MKQNEGERIAVLETEFKNVRHSIDQLGVLIKEETLKIRNDLTTTRIETDKLLSEHKKDTEIRLRENEKAIQINTKFREKLLTQIGLIVGVGAIVMTFVYEFIKRWIGNFFK